MANNCLGVFDVDIKDTPFAAHTPADWALYFVSRYGQFDGGHHKAWALDQVARILKGTPVIVQERRWTDHAPEFDVTTGEPSQEYLDWVTAMKGAWDEDSEEYEYWYEEGTPP